MKILPIVNEYRIQNRDSNYKNFALKQAGIFNNYADTVSFSGKSYDKNVLKPKDSYNTFVRELGDFFCKKTTVDKYDIDFLLRLNDKDFKKVITSPVKCQSGSGRQYYSTIFFYTDAEATEKLLDKLNDKKAAYKILKTKQGWSGTTALHSAVYSNDVDKARVICESVSKKDLIKLMNMEDVDDDVLGLAISQSNDTLDLIKRYHDRKYDY